MAEVRPRKIIRLSKSCIGESEKKAVMEVLDKEYLGMGEEVQEFEKALTNYFGRQAVCVVNGTAALQLALQAAGIGVGDEVLVPSLTYVASFQAITANGAVPVACDVDSKTLTLDWKDAEQRLTDKTKAVMPVHYGGDVGGLDEIYKFAERYKLRVIEDAAHAFGSKYQGRVVGGFGDIACFSFDGIKNLTSGEGGCIVTSDVEVLSRVRDARLLGVEKDTEKRYAGQRSWDFNVTSQGWRYHMSNVMAAIGIQQLQRFPELAAKRQKLSELYVQKLRGCPSIFLLNRSYREIVPHIFPVVLREEAKRKGLIEWLSASGVQTGIHYQPNHLLSFFESKESKSLPVTESLSGRLLTLPLHPDLRECDVDFVSKLVLHYFENE